MGRPAFQRASMNGVNATPVGPGLPFHEYLSSCSSGNSSTSNSRQRETPSMNLLSIQRVFTLVNDLRSRRHSMRLNPLCSTLCSSDDQLSSPSSSSRVRRPTVEKIWLNELEICVTEDACQSKSKPLPLTVTEMKHFPVSPRG